MNRIALRNTSCYHSVAGLVVCRELSFFRAYDSALLFRSCDNFGDSLFYLLHPYETSVSSGCYQRSLIEQILYIGRGKSRSSPGQYRRSHIVGKRLVLAVNLEDLLTSFYVRNSDDYLSVKTSRPQKRRIQDVRSVGRRQYYDTRILCESVHLHQKLIESLLTLIVASSDTGSSLTAYCVNLVDKHYARRVFLRLIEQVSHPGSSDSDKHLDKIRTAYRKERNACFAGSSF